LADAIKRVGAGGADVVVRINSNLRLAAPDLEQAVCGPVSAICVPKVSGTSQLQWLSECIDELEDLGSEDFSASAGMQPALRENRGAAEQGGKMIDAPVVARALETLASHRRISGEES
jgi:citrate lyase beta subunit